MVSTRRSISSSSTSVSALGAANNNNNTLGLVPLALPRRKILRTRTMQNRKRRRNDIILITISVAVTIVFALPFVPLHLITNNSSEHIIHSNKIDLSFGKNHGGGEKIENRGTSAAVNVIDFQKQKQKNLRGGEEDQERNIWVSQKSQPFNERGLAVHAENLVMVAGHSVTVSGHLQDAGSDESDWLLLG
jgi:hypothetical protein